MESEKVLEAEMWSEGLNGLRFASGGTMLAVIS